MTEQALVSAGLILTTNRVEPLPPERNPAAVYLARLAPGSRPTMRGALDTIAAIATGGQLDAERCPWHRLRYPHSAAIRARLTERYAPATTNRHLAALRGVLKEAWRLGLISPDDCARAADLPAARGDRLPAGRELRDAELRALFGVCEEDGSPAGPRDAALLALLFGAGLRRSEAVGLDLADYDASTGALTIRRGKGDQQRVCYARNGAQKALAAWLTARGIGAGPLLCPVNRGGKIQLRRMTAQAVLLRLRDRGQEAGVDHFSPHDLRRSFISHLLDSGADLVTVQHLAGHANVTTTARYDRRGEVAKKKAAELLHVPYRGPQTAHVGAQ